MINARLATNKVYDAVNAGTLSWEQVAQAALIFLSEDDVAQMSHNEEFFMYEDEDEDEEEDLLEDTHFLIDEY